jgi:hypothetical protein
LSDGLDIEANLAKYVGNLRADARYASFDYCFNYFQTHRESGTVAALAEGANMEVSCLQLGFYLASWGMLRGSSVLLQRSVRHFRGVVSSIASLPAEAWQIDANDYSTAACDLLLDTGRRIRSALDVHASDILVTKIMLGVLGCVPAFDTNFKRGFRGASTFGLVSLRRIAEFYESNAELIDRHRLPTMDFETGQPTARLYTRAKVIDMIFFIEGEQ